MTSALTAYENTFLEKNGINNTSIYQFKRNIENPFNINSTYSVTSSLYNLLALQNQKNTNFCILNPSNLDNNNVNTIIKPKDSLNVKSKGNQIPILSSNSESDVSESYSSATSRRSSFSQNSPNRRISKKELSPEAGTDSVSYKRSNIKSDVSKFRRGMMIRDDAYWERRRRNNDAAKRSRDSRRKKVRKKIKDYIS
uniref:BZIP domain-containing protein n=1 Tax=Parastrongyloides trichosuri TaxID=131310 RepID=A0A0N4Z0H9_PARTI